MNKKVTHTFPFTAIVGQEDFKTALILNIIDPTIGGVLAIGDKGTGKTTLIRSLARLMNNDSEFPFVNMPIGASEDRVLGHLNLEKLINDKKEELQEGLLAKAHQGILYVDEINLLNDYLMDVLLDAAASGSYQLEREGVSRKLDSQFCLIGSMNPEEGDLRPQLKDRFGLSVNISTTNNVEERVKIISSRLNFDDNPEQFGANFKVAQENLYKSILAAKKKLTEITYTQEELFLCSKIALENQVEGLRTDILLLKTARAYAALQNCNVITEENIQKIAPFVLNHRSNNFQQQQQEKEQSNNKDNSNPSINKESESKGGKKEHVFESILPQNELAQKLTGAHAERKGNLENLNNSLASGSLAPKPIAENIDRRKTVGQYLAKDKFELKYKLQNSKSKVNIIFILDSSGSMIKDNVIAYAKGLVEKFAQKNQFAKIQLSLISLYDGDAQLIAEPCTDVQVLVEKLQKIKTGGKTNVLPAFQKVKELTAKQLEAKHELVLVTDGRFNTGRDNDFAEAVSAYQTYCKKVDNLTVIDAEQGHIKLGLAKTFSESVKGKYETLITVI